MRKMCIALGLMLALASAAYAGDQDFTLVNASSSPICYVYISPSSSGDWGDDVLGAKECLEAGESIEIIFNGSSQKMWDLRVEDPNGKAQTYTGFNLMEISKITLQGGGKASYQ